MKKGPSGRVFLFLVIFGSMAGSFSSAETAASKPAAPEVKTYTWQEKLKRGSLNVVSSPVEIAREIQNTTNESNLLKGWTVGLVKGFGEGFMRCGAGAVDVFTCPWNFPDAHKGPLLEPEYVWQKPGPKYT